MLEKNMSDIVSFIENNIESKLSVDLISKIAGYSRRYTELIFKRYTGISLGRYIKIRKLTRAVYLLQYTSLKIIDISFRLSFDSPQSFSREFKKRFGVSPLTCRKKDAWDASLMMHPFTSSNEKGFFLDIVTMKPEIIHGFYISHVENIPFNKYESTYRWGVISKEMQIKRNPFRLFSVFMPDSLNYSQLRVQALVESTQQTETDSQLIFEGGLYASYYFEGTINEYSEFVAIIYSGGMKKNYLIKRKGCFVELFERFDYNSASPVIACFFYIPVIEDK